MPASAVGRGAGRSSSIHSRWYRREAGCCAICRVSGPRTGSCSFRRRRDGVFGESGRESIRQMAGGRRRRRRGWRPIRDRDERSTATTCLIVLQLHAARSAAATSPADSAKPGPEQHSRDRESWRSWPSKSAASKSKRWAGRSSESPLYCACAQREWRAGRGRSDSLEAIFERWERPAQGELALL